MATPSAPAKDTYSSPARKVSQSVPPKAQSRLPRMRHTSGSLSEINTSPVLKQLRPLPSRPKAALSERSLNDSNIENIDPTAPINATNTTRTRSTSDAQSALSDSYGSVVIHGTVAQKQINSPVNDNDTPEWKRRLLKGEVGYGEQKDLFSPMGLENIFQKPAGGSTDEPKQRFSKLGLSTALNAVPSSPPPWPVDRSRQVSKEEDEQPQEKPEQPTDDPQPEQGAEDPNDSTAYYSSLHPSEIHASEANMRAASGQTELNETFSEVHLSLNRKPHLPPPAPAVQEFSASSLAQRLRHLGTPPPPTFTHQAPTDEASFQQRSRVDSSFSRLQDEPLPEDLPAGTPDVVDVLTPFVERRRGGYAHEGNFQRRPLSPSPQPKKAPRPPSITTSVADSNVGYGRRNRDSTGTVELHPPPKVLSPAPQSPMTPHRPKQQEFLTPGRRQAPGTPLKLFDAHDTFTSNRLQRRLSQLEYKSEKTTSGTQVTESTRVLHKTASRMTSVEEVSVQQMSPKVPASPAVGKRGASPRRVSRFGLGLLDDYLFPEDNSVFYSDDSLVQEDLPADSPRQEVPPPGSRAGFRFELNDMSPAASLRASKARRQGGLTRVSKPMRRVTQNYKPPTAQPVAQSGLQVPSQEYTDGKRGPTSPFKDPTPKRRRTLHELNSSAEDVFSDEAAPPDNEAQAVLQAAYDKSKETRQTSRKFTSESEWLARKNQYRPRNPTPNQRMRGDVQAEVLEATEAFLNTSPKLETIREQLDRPSSSGDPSEEAQAAAVAKEIAAFTMKRAGQMRDNSRKRSVTTQDFLDEAVKIMQFLRTKGRPNSGLESLEESGESQSAIIDDDNLQVPPAPLSFSRPPSREGRPSMWKEPNKHTLDAKVASHLRKYQERESDDFIGSSMNSVKFNRVKGHVYHEGNSVIVEQDDIRITDDRDRPNMHHDNFDDHEERPMTSGTNNSAASSMGHTVATNFSRRTEHVNTLAPEQVAHLIPKLVGGMSFDREQNRWVRNKNASREHRPMDTSASEMTEDPFGNIPDLSVDETAENMLTNQTPNLRPQATAETLLEDTDPGYGEPHNHSRPVTREGKGSAPTDTSSVPSKLSNHFAWSYGNGKTETRATSYSDQDAKHGYSQKTQHAPTTFPIPENDELEVEHEIKYFEGRERTSPFASARIRDITFSIEQPRPSTSPQRKAPPIWGYSHSRQNSHTPSGQWRQMPGTGTLPRRGTIPAEGELSIIEDSQQPSKYRMQLSMSVQAPVLGVQNQDALVSAPSSPPKADMTFMLSDLPEFTLHQVDECELPERVVVKHDGRNFSKSLEDRYAQGTAELIKALQDVVPDEPFWEDIRKVDLHDKNLTNLHRLDEFCYRLEELNVSNNDISQVKGIPYTMRRLNAHNNCLTSLTNWQSLMNLQHLDISNNEIDSLDGLSDLVHLRTLKVDDNHIRSLSGIMMLDGLMELSAKGNQIGMVDFAKADL